ncbi:MAG TPA: glycosyltransferase family 4 protein [Lacunisphaera sp.]|nr:glycosyltransferase family 4 protein [Lacunisphaera sp.]
MSRQVVIVTHEFFPHRGGIAVFAAEMAAGARQLGYAVEVWAPDLPAGMEERPWPFQVLRLPLAGNHSLWSQWRMARRLARQRDRLRSAILYVPEPGPLLALLLLQFFDALEPAQLILTFHGSEIQRLASRRILRWCTNRLLSRSTRISVVSEYARQLLETHFPAAASKVMVVSGTLRSDIRPCAAAVVPRVDGKTIILTVARLNPRKGQLQVIEALKGLPAELRARIEYWLVGSHAKENYHEVLAKAAANAGFPVRFLGDVPDEELGAIYAQADIFAMTSMPHRFSVEGFGLVYLEAGAHGLPVVAHDIGGVPEAVADGETGLLVPPGDQPALTRAFEGLLRDPALRRRLGEAGRARALRFTWVDAAKSLFGQPPPEAPESSQ